MNGTDHYRAAEILLDNAKLEHGLLNAAEVAVIVAEAQVHATLALAAATALSMTTHMVGDTVEITQWAEVITPSFTERQICSDGCEDKGDGCHGICNARRAARPIIDEEPPF
jgi:hypothetical protein